jgi:hypothetical protein
MVDEGKNLIERFASAGPKVREQLGYAGRMVRGRERALHRAVVVQHCWQGPNIDMSRRPAPRQIAASERRLRLSVEPFIAND